jgi:metal-responsive CopG/Arc/MetJ family transcriptional regulator
MSAPNKVKVSITLPADLVTAIDREAQRSGMSRSWLIEDYVRVGASRAAERSLEEATAAYYASLQPADRAEDLAIARASSAAAKRVAYDQPVRRGGRARRTRR